MSDLLVLIDVTGTWEGTVRGSAMSSVQGARIPITAVFQQSGPKVTGELSWSRGQGLVEGVVNGEVLTLSEGIRAELAVDGDEMWGRVDGFLVHTMVIDLRCPCFLRFRRAGSPGPAPSEPPVRQQ